MKILTFVVLILTSVLLPGRAEERPVGLDTSKTACVAFAQYCFWTGEMQLGQIEGVVRTEAGYFQGREVTLVDYDPDRVSLAQLARQAKQAGVADRIHLPADLRPAAGSIAGVALGAPLDRSYRTAPASDQKKQLEGTPYARLKLTPEQATKVNAFVRVNPAKARAWLTTPQREALVSAH